MTVINRLVPGEQDPVKIAAAVNQIAEFIDRDVKLGSFTRDISLSTALTITGLGFTPKVVAFMSIGVSSNKFGGIGFDNGTISPFLDIDLTDAQLFQQPQQIIHKDVGNYNFFSISSMNADGFTLAWTKTGTPTGTATIYYLALG